MFWDSRDALDRAARQPMTALPSSAGDVAGASWDEFWAEDATVSEALMTRRAWDEVLQGVADATGERLANPGVLLMGVDTPVDMAGDAIAGAITGGAWSQSRRGQYQTAAEETRDRLRALGITPPTDQDILDVAARLADERRAKAEEARAGASGWGQAAGMAATMGAAMLDPPNLATLPLGAGAGSIGRVVLTEAALGAAVEAGNQVQVARWKQKIGRDYGLDDAALNTALAGAGAGVFAGAIKGGADLWKFWRGARKAKVAPETPETKAAEHLAARQAQVEETSPYAPGDLAGEEMHAGDLQAMEDALLTGRPLPRPQYMEHVRQGLGRVIAEATSVGGDGGVQFGRPPKATMMRLREHLGWTVTGEGGIPDVNRRMLAGEIRHALTKHGADPLPLTPEHLRAVPEVLENGEFVGFDRGHMVHRAEVDGAWLYVVEEIVGQKRVTLHFKTAYRTPKGRVGAGARFSRSMPDGREAHVRNAGDNPAGPDMNMRPSVAERKAPDFRPLPDSLKAETPESLVSWLKRAGGLKDAGGELAAMDAARRVGLVSGKGLEFDDAAIRAWEEKFFDDVPEIDQLLQAVRKELGGEKLWRVEDLPAVERAASAEALRRDVEDLLGSVDAARGLDDTGLMEVLDTARGRRAWEAVAADMPLAEAEARGIAAEAKATGRDMDDVAMDWAEARARMIEDAHARDDGLGDIPFEAGSATARIADDAEAAARQRWQDAQAIALEHPARSMARQVGEDADGAPLWAAEESLEDLFRLVDEDDAMLEEVSACVMGRTL